MSNAFLSVQLRCNLSFFTTDYRHREHVGVVDKFDAIRVVSFLRRAESDVINVKESWSYRGAETRSVILDGEKRIGVARDLQMPRHLKNRRERNLAGN